MTNTPQLTQAERELLHRLRREKAARRAPPSDTRSTGQRIADQVASIVGSWRFILVQSALLTVWIVLNVTAWIRAWDPYPFILLNLVLSFQAAYTAPILMMSQNRQAEIDRRDAANDYEVNVKAELEIELLHTKLDALREQEIARLIEVIETLAGRSPAPP